MLDMRLPGRSGMEVLERLRARGFERPVLVLTAQDAIDAKVSALRAGADDYVTKPFAFEELLARVEALSRRPRALAAPVLRVADLELIRPPDASRGRAGASPAKECAVLEDTCAAGRGMSRTMITSTPGGITSIGTNIGIVSTTSRRSLEQRRDSSTPSAAWDTWCARDALVRQAR